MYRLLLYGEEHVRQEAEAYEAAYRARVVKGLTCRAADPNYRLQPEPTAGR